MGQSISKPFRKIWLRCFSSHNKVCIWMLGGPGSGRTTQSRLISEHFQLSHISPEREIHKIIETEEARKPEAKRRRLHKKRVRIHNAIKIHEMMTKDEKEFLGIHESTAQAHLLASYFRSDTEEDDQDRPVYIKSLEESVKHGYQLDPYIITKILKTRMHEVARTCNGFVMDGYPRDLTQALLLLSQSHRVALNIIIFLECPDSVLGERLISRAVAAQRSDDNELMVPFKLETWRIRSKTMHVRFADSMHIIDGNRPGEIVADDCFSLIKKKAAEKKFKFQNFDRPHLALWRNLMKGANKVKVGVKGESKISLKTHIELNQLGNLP